MKERCIEFAWLDAWLADLRDAVERRLTTGNPSIKTDRLAKLSEIDTIRDSKYTWVFIGGKIRFVVSEKDGTIIEAEGGRIKSKKQYGKLGEWERWNWASYYPYLTQLWDWQKGTIENVSNKEIHTA